MGKRARNYFRYAPLFLLFGANLIRADFVFLKDGKVIESKIVERTDTKIILKDNTEIERSRVLGVRYGPSLKKVTVSDGSESFSGILLSESAADIKLIIAGKVVEFERTRFTVAKPRPKPVERNPVPRPEAVPQNILLLRSGLNPMVSGATSDFFMTTGLEVFLDTGFNAFVGFHWSQVFIRNADERQVDFPGYNLVNASVARPFVLSKSIWVPVFIPQIGPTLNILNASGEVLTSAGFSMGVKFMWRVKLQGLYFHAGIYAEQMMQQGDDFPTAGIFTGVRF